MLFFGQVQRWHFQWKNKYWLSFGIYSHTSQYLQFWIGVVLVIDNFKYQQNFLVEKNSNVTRLVLQWVDCAFHKQSYIVYVTATYFKQKHASW